MACGLFEAVEKMLAEDKNKRAAGS